MAKVVLIGAGSGFGAVLAGDILTRPALWGSTICLCDANEGRLRTVADHATRLAAAYDPSMTVRADVDRERLLEGADFVVTAINAGEGGAYWGRSYADDKGIPMRYGIDQSIADTLGPGGIFRFLRLAPEQLAICRDMERLCPRALLLNYTNPMAMLTWLHTEASAVRHVGLCHSVQGTTQRLAEWAGADYGRVSFTVAGINHQAWVLDIREGGRDLYPTLRRRMEEEEVLKHDRVRFEMMRQFGYFVTEGSGHNSEYLPYFRRTPELMKRYDLRHDEVPMRPPTRRGWADDTGGGTTGDTSATSVDVPPLVRSHEFATAIMEACVTDEPLRFHGNVANTGLIGNLPQGCCVEVACVADAQGIHPCHHGDLPAQCAAVNRTNVSVQELAVRAFLDRDREAAFHATALDPLTAACAGLPEIRRMFDELWQANEPFLDGYCR